MRTTTLGIRNIEIRCDHRNHRILRRLRRRRRLVATVRLALAVLPEAADIEVRIRLGLRLIKLGVFSTDDAAHWRERVAVATNCGLTIRLPAMITAEPCPEIWIGEELA